MTIQLKQEGSICYIYLNRPEKLNALTGLMIEDLSKSLDRIDKTHTIRSVIIMGVGNGFCAGMDVTELANCTPVQAKSRAKQTRAICSKIEKLSKPVIAVVHGVAYGAGFEMALACDFIIATTNSTYALPQINLGIIPSFMGSAGLVNALGKHLFTKLLFAGDVMKSKTLCELGILYKCVAEGREQTEAKKLANKLSMDPPVAIQMAKTAAYDDKKFLDCHVKTVSSKCAKARLSTVFKRKKK